MSEKQFVTDGSGKKREVFKNVAGQNVVAANTPGRVLLCIVLFIVAVGFLRQYVEPWLVIVIAVLVVVVLRELLLKKVVTDNELKDGKTE
jgi:hypothetical protein